ERLRGDPPHRWPWDCEGGGVELAVRCRCRSGRRQQAAEGADAGGGSVGYLGASAGEPPKAVLSVRSFGRPAVILSPRDTLVLPGPLTFEWLGTQFSRY